MAEKSRALCCRYVELNASPDGAGGGGASKLLTVAECSPAFSTAFRAELAARMRINASYVARVECAPVAAVVGAPWGVGTSTSVSTHSPATPPSTSGGTARRARSLRQSAPGSGSAPASQAGSSTCADPSLQLLIKLAIPATDPVPLVQYRERLVAAVAEWAASNDTNALDVCLSDMQDTTSTSTLVTVTYNVPLSAAGVEQYSSMCSGGTSIGASSAGQGSLPAGASCSVVPRKSVGLTLQESGAPRGNTGSGAGSGEPNWVAIIAGAAGGGAVLLLCAALAALAVMRRKRRQQEALAHARGGLPQGPAQGMGEVGVPTVVGLVQQPTMHACTYKQPTMNIHAHLCAWSRHAWLPCDDRLVHLGLNHATCTLPTSYEPAAIHA